MARRSRASNRYEPADSRDFGPRFGYRDSRSISAATRRTYSRDRVSPGPVRHTRSPSPHYNRPIRRSRAQICRSSDPRKRYFSPYGRRHKSFDYERPLQNPERGDINQSNKISMLIPHGRPDYRECSTQWSCPDLEPYTNDPYDSVSDYKQRRPWTEFDDEHVHYLLVRVDPELSQSRSVEARTGRSISHISRTALSCQGGIIAAKYCF